MLTLKSLVSLFIQDRALRNTDSDILIADLLVAFDKLDSIEKIPTIYCEGQDLLKLPSLEVDCISQRLRMQGGPIQFSQHSFSSFAH